MPELQTLLRHYGDHLEELAPPITSDELVTVPLQSPSPPPWWRHPALVATAAVALVIIVIGGLSFLISGDPEDAVVEPTVTTVVPTTIPEATPEPTTPPPTLLPQPPALGDAIDLHPDHLALAALIIEAEIVEETSNFEVNFEEDEAGGWRSANGDGGTGTLRAFAEPEAASAYMAARMAEEQATELEQPNPSLGIGDESVVYRQIVPRVGEVDVYLVRVGTVVMEAQHFDPDGLEPEFDTTAMTTMISAIRSPQSPSVTAFQPQVGGE